MKRSLALRWTAGAATAITSAAIALMLPMSPAQAADNLSLSAGADGSSKASGTSYGNVKDGNTSTYWAPTSATGSVSVKWTSATTVSSAVIKQASGGGTISAWRVLNADSGSVLTSGSGSPSTISFTSTALKKLTFEITSASAAPRIAEFETYNGGGTTPTTSPTASPTTSPTSGTGTPTGAWPSSAGSVSVSGTISVSGTFDGGMKTYCCIGDGSQSESQDPMFSIANGGTLQNVIIGSPAGDGVHCEGTCTIKNVWWNDIGEDAATFKGTGGGTSYVIGGGARSGSDKTFQHNGNGTVSISGFYLSGSGKLYRGCGNCTNSYQRNVKIDNVLLNDIDMVAGINSNWGDVATITRVTISNSSSVVVCGKYKGVAKGSEPTYLGEGWNDTNCKVTQSDITYK
ncbi:pectate lyase [Actinoplanes awajinensis]|uniref:pectate lyase n=1 Tax=Actinoplanes awajinensis subsp. mycoplanecinus TaxID=135947 RepID=A0A0X3V9G1_9ACTN|nr:pectate lyase [Actinoplanes awajinensis]KUL41415.1 pectate lyase [Actinoplanes awajinensis subsp. mycoplanecinus]